jgi:carbon monoxide dehydrogenase subunit G
MDMTGERRIPAPREKVWTALNDPDVLKASIPGCETLEKLSPTDMRATAGVKIGPISARFTGNVHLLDLDPPNGYRIEGEGQSGAGFAKGGAAVRLTDDGADTLLTYEVKAQVGGKIAQLGARLIDATAKQMADAFFTRFAAAVGGGAPAPPVATPAVAPADTGATPAIPPSPSETVQPKMVPSMSEPLKINILSLIPSNPYGYPLVAWIGAAIFAVIFIMIFGSYVF